MQDRSQILLADVLHPFAILGGSALHQAKPMHKVAQPIGAAIGKL
jgi:hypothetical protein